MSNPRAHVLKARCGDRTDRKTCEHDGYKFEVVRAPRYRRSARRGKPVIESAKAIRIARKRRKQNDHKDVINDIARAAVAIELGLEDYYGLA